MLGIRRWWRERIIRRHLLDAQLWREVLEHVPLAAGLDEVRRERLRRLATLFVHDKDFYAVGGLELDDSMVVAIAAQSCIPVLNLGWDWLRGWHSIYVYPGQFRTGREFRDEHGLEYRDERVLAGEAHEAGGMVLSWTDVAEDIAAGADGQNVVVHEIAHKLDMRNGRADGYPPLHRGMSRERWARVMGEAFEAMNAALDRGRRTRLDPYAASEPAEFFAVMSEYHFETPELLASVYPDVEHELALFYGGSGEAGRAAGEAA